jgi:hypothetical protein
MKRWISRESAVKVISESDTESFIWTDIDWRRERNWLEMGEYMEHERAI